jgi:hypothetical protein
VRASARVTLILRHQGIGDFLLERTSCFESSHGIIKIKGRSIIDLCIVEVHESAEDRLGAWCADVVSRLILRSI